MESLDKAKLAYQIIKERKAIDPVLFQVGELTSIADFFLIAGGSSTRQTQAIARHLEKRMREKGFRAYGVEGNQEGQWILMDYGDLVVHIFYHSSREFYDLEGLWVEAPRITVEDESRPFRTGS